MGSPRISRTINLIRLDGQRLLAREQNHRPATKKTTWGAFLPSFLLAPFLLIFPAVAAAPGCGQIEEAIEQLVDVVECGVPEVRDKLKACGKNSENISLNHNFEYVEGQPSFLTCEQDYLSEVIRATGIVLDRIINGDVYIDLNLRFKPSESEGQPVTFEIKDKEYTACGGSITIEAGLWDSLWLSMFAREMIKELFWMLPVEKNPVPADVFEEVPAILAYHALLRAEYAYEGEGWVGREAWEWVHDNLLCGDGRNLEMPALYEYQLGYLYYKNNEYKRAVDLFQQVVNDGPTDSWWRAEAICYLDECYKQLGG